MVGRAGTPQLAAQLLVPVCPPADLAGIASYSHHHWMDYKKKESWTHTRSVQAQRKNTAPHEGTYRTLRAHSIYSKGNLCNERSVATL